MLLASALLRLWNLGSGDTLSDEVLYSFRAIGMLDFDEAADQTTPLEWFDPHIPAWTVYSFHDHPPLAFAVQHVFMRIFGETTFAFRLPSALLGIASVYLLYLIGSLLYNERVGLLAAGIFGLTVQHIAISRLGLQEAYVLFFLLLATYFFLKAETEKKYYIWLGIAGGLGLLTKYTTGIFIPIFITYALFYRQKDVFSRHVWIGAFLILLICSPVLYYNFKLYQTVGHFDFQLSFIFGQNPDIWGIQPGKEEFPTFTSRLTAFLPNLIKFNSWMFVLLFGINIIALIFSIAKRGRETLRDHALLLIIFLWLAAFIIGVIGPSMRFLSMLTPFMTLGISYTFVQFSVNFRKPSFRKFPKYITCILIVFETLYSLNSQLLAYPMGQELWAWSGVRDENYNWGYQELDTWIREQTDNRMPALAFEPKYHFIGEIHKKALAQAERDGKKPLATLFVYDKNIHSIPQLWILDRLQIYHAWPIITADTYVQFLKEKGQDYFAKSGFTEVYYIFPTENVPWKKQQYLTNIGAKLEHALTESGHKPYRILRNKRNDETFRIYRSSS